MNNEISHDVVFGATACCTLIFAATAFMTLLYRLITVAVPFLESTIGSQITSTRSW